MTIARDGWREILISTVICHSLAGACLWAARQVSPLFWIPAVALWGVWLFTVAFFRDPYREIPSEPGILVSPADGKVTEVSRLDRYEGIDGPALRISIFLSVFNVHVNRVPCAGRVRRIAYQPGEFLDARHPECGIRNEANTIVIDPAQEMSGPVIVRQVAGLIARRIVCNLREGDPVERGQRLGLIKFGSRTDLIVPAASGLEPAVRVNDVVSGGDTVLLRPARSRAGQGGPRGAGMERREAAARH
ncbi:MAG: phosphatidylserine decarboxylase family protein [Planctomycetota bacterium]|nr:MAG: phosphatidylserine decarboxylase family protein [Planctomycetota bacterium]